MTDHYITSRVEEGARLLDQMSGDQHWRRYIDRDTLDLGDECACILGQTFGDYAAGWEEIEQYLIDAGEGYDVTAAMFGFDAYSPTGYREEFAALRAAWLELLCPSLAAVSS